MNMQNNDNTNPKTFWTFYKSRKSLSLNPTTMSYLDNEVNPGNETVNLFKLHFSNVYKPHPLKKKKM
jgi:hypothetical protein